MHLFVQICDWRESAMSYPPYGAPGGYPPAGPGYPVILYIYYYNRVRQ